MTSTEALSAQRTVWWLASCSSAAGAHISNSLRLHSSELLWLICLNITQAAHLKAALAQVSPSLRLNPLDTKQRLERTDHSSLLCSAVCHLDKGTI